jgi:meso-butanediol dehydrogenase/(S,S)-butanediol dehydrogenase/diacetyl reductase
MERFVEKVVIITGAGSGIGAATAKRFLEEGGAVVLNRRPKSKLEETANGFPEERTLIDSGDIADKKYALGLVERTIERFHKLDILVNNAAISILGSFGGTPEEDWHRAKHVYGD